MLVGYARTSTVEQVAGLEAQQRDLKAKKCEKIFVEQISSVDADRKQLEAAIDFVREGDTFICTRLDRLARSVVDLLKIEERLKAKGVALLILDPAMDTSTPTGRLMFNVIASIAQFEREIMLSRQREGIAAAKAKGLLKGRAPVARAKADQVRALHAERLGATYIARKVGISVRSVYNIINETPEDSSAYVAAWERNVA